MSFGTATSGAYEKVTSLEMMARGSVHVPAAVSQTKTHTWLKWPCECARMRLRQRAAIVAVCLAAALVNSCHSVITGERIVSKIITGFS